MNDHHIKERLDASLHRGGHQATEEELVEVTAELAGMIAELQDRVGTLESTLARKADS